MTVTAPTERAEAAELIDCADMLERIAAASSYHRLGDKDRRAVRLAARWLRWVAQR